MAQLETCPECQRHVRVGESQCPFCSADLSVAFADVKVRVLPRTRLGRAALFAFGVTAAATLMPGCEDDDDDDDGEDADGGDTGGQSGGSANQDANSSGQPVYGAPAIDAGGQTGGDSSGVAPLYGLPPSDSGVQNNEPDAGGVVAIYGAAPED